MHKALKTFYRLHKYHSGTTACYSETVNTSPKSSIVDKGLICQPLKAYLPV